jgi:hypothetical protein
LSLILPTPLDHQKLTRTVSLLIDTITERWLDLVLGREALELTETTELILMINKALAYEGDRIKNVQLVDLIKLIFQYKDL